MQHTRRAKYFGLKITECESPNISKLSAASSPGLLMPESPGVQAVHASRGKNLQTRAAQKEAVKPKPAAKKEKQAGTELTWQPGLPILLTAQCLCSVTPMPCNLTWVALQVHLSP